MAEPLHRIIGFSLMLAAVLWGQASESAGGAENNAKLQEIHNGARPVADEGYVMFVDPAKRYIIVKERKFVIGHYRINKKIRATLLKDANGAGVALDHFKAGQWVALRGFGISKATTHATSVQRLGGYLEKEVRTIERTKPKRLP